MESTYEPIKYISDVNKYYGGSSLIKRFNDNSHFFLINFIKILISGFIYFLLISLRWNASVKKLIYKIF